MEVQHFQILAWQEGENPASLPGLLEVLQDPEVQYPLLVHSHNGVGRTGVIVCIHRALKCVAAGGHLDMPGIVRHMRQQRGGMIQTLEQYKTCISGVLRYLQYVTGYTTMSIEDGAATSLPLLDIIHPKRSHTVTTAVSPLVSNVAKQHAQIPRTFSDPTLQGSPQTKRRLYLQNMIPPPPTYPPPYSDDDAARVPSSPQVPISPPPPMTPPDNEPGATASSDSSPIQLKEDTSANKSILQRDTMRASQHDSTAAKFDEELEEEITEESPVTTKPMTTKAMIEEDDDDDDIFTKTFGSLEKLPTKKSDTSSEAEEQETTTTTIEKTPVQETDSSEQDSSEQDSSEQITVEVPLETEETSNQSEAPEMQVTEPSTTVLVLPTIEDTRSPITDQQEQQEELMKQATEAPPATQQPEPSINQEQTQTSVINTAKLFGGMKQQSKSFTNVWKQQNSIGELARKFGGTKQPSLTKQTKSFSHAPKGQSSLGSVGDLAKKFGGQSTQPPTKTSTTSPPMENQTLTFTFDAVDKEFSEMTLTRSIETQPESSTEPQQTEQLPTDTRDEPQDTSTPRTSPNTAPNSSSASRHPFKTPSASKDVNQRQPGKVKKLDMSKFAMFGKSIND